MTKAQIVQRLLEAELINAEEAVILLQPDSVPFHTVTPPAPSSPYWTSPWANNPYWTSTQTGVPSFSSNPSEYYRDPEDI
jgi:hypothetical protein